MISGSLLKPGKLIIDFIRSQGGLPEASVAATNMRTNVILAALGNATLAHADETDDAHFPTVTHPGSVIVPATFALAERDHHRGKEVISAVVLGYDIMCRVSRALDRNWMSERGLHTGSISGGFGAAAAASYLLGLSEKEIRFAMAFVGSQASGLNTWRQDPEHVDKALIFSGIPARNGLTAALWAKGGFTATSAIFEGPDNLFKAFCEQPRPEELSKELGTRFELLETSIKKYPGGQPMQATLEGYFKLVRDHAIQTESIQKILVRLPESQARTVNDRMMPDVNCQYLLAVAMLDGKVDFQSSHDFARMRDPKLLELKKRVYLQADPELTKKHPAVRSAVVEITTQDGHQYETLVDRLPGAPYNPFSPKEIEEKFLLLSEPVLGKSQCGSLVERVLGLEKENDVASVTGLLRVEKS